MGRVVMGSGSFKRLSITLPARGRLPAAVVGTGVVLPSCCVVAFTTWAASAPIISANTARYMDSVTGYGDRERYKNTAWPGEMAKPLPMLRCNSSYRLMNLRADSRTASLSRCRRDHTAAAWPMCARYASSIGSTSSMPCGIACMVLCTPEDDGIAGMPLNPESGDANVTEPREVDCRRGSIVNKRSMTSSSSVHGTRDCR